MSKNNSSLNIETEDIKGIWYDPKQISNVYNGVEKKLIIVIIICFLFMITEIIGGVISNSIAIITDAAHMLSDGFGFLFSLISVLLAKKKASNQLSFGYHRAEILGALISILLIWIVTFFLLFESINRLNNLDKIIIDGKIMFITAVIGVICNIIMALSLHSSNSGITHQGCNHDHDEENQNKKYHILENNENKNLSLISEKDNLNMRATIIHIIGDLIISFAVTISSLIIWFYPNMKILDPICTILFSIVVLFTTKNIIRDCIKVLMEGTPDSINIDKIKKDLMNIKGIKEIHDLHIWELTQGKPILIVHIYGDDIKRILKEATIYARTHGIYHTTIQVENFDDNNHLINCNNNIHE